MEIFVSAGDASSDIHCGKLVAELKQIASKNGTVVRFSGLGGEALEREAVEILLHNRELSVGGGPLEVLSKLPLRRRFEKKLEERWFSTRRPDLAVLVDNGEINLRLASLLHFFGVPVVYFIPPKVWAWRASRLEDLFDHVDLVLSILPFEEPIYRAWEIPFAYVGNPLVDEIDFSKTVEVSRRELGIPPGRDVICVMPGSRHSELRYHLPIFSSAIAAFLREVPEAERPVVIVPLAPAADEHEVRTWFSKERLGTDLLVTRGKSHDCLRVARAALVKSGTSTLEAGLLGAPMLLAYKSSRTSEWIYRNVIRYRGFVGMVNLFHASSAESALGIEASREAPVVPELILGDCTPENIARGLRGIYLEGEARSRMLARLACSRTLVLSRDGGSPIRRAAELVWNLQARGSK